MFQPIQKRSGQDSQTLIQPSLEIGKEEDEHEKEANKVADKVMKMPDGTGGQGKMKESPPMMQKMTEGKSAGKMQLSAPLLSKMKGTEEEEEKEEKEPAKAPAVIHRKIQMQAAKGGQAASKLAAHEDYNQFPVIFIPYDHSSMHLYDDKAKLLKSNTAPNSPGLIMNLEEGKDYLFKVVTDEGTFDYSIPGHGALLVRVGKKALKGKLTETDGDIKFIGKEDKTKVTGGETTTAKLVDAGDKSHKISDAVSADYNKAAAKILTLTGFDLTGSFGDVTRTLGTLKGSSGSDPVSWHKTGRAVDIDQSSQTVDKKKVGWVIAKDPRGEDMYFHVYLPLKSDQEKGIDASGDKKFIKTFAKDDKTEFQSNATYNKKLVDVTAVFGEYGFMGIKAQKGYETDYNKLEWWHFEKKDGLTMYQALRELYTEKEIIKGYKTVVAGTKSGRASREKRFLAEGFPSYIIKAIYDTPVVFGKLSLYLSVGAETQASNFPDDLAALETVLAELGYPVANAVNIIRKEDIAAIQDVSLKLTKIATGTIEVGRSLHKAIGEAVLAPAIKGTLKLYGNVGDAQMNFPADVISVKTALNENFDLGLLKGVMAQKIVINSVCDAQFIEAIRLYQEVVLKAKTATGTVTKGGTTQTKLGTHEENKK